MLGWRKTSIETYFLGYYCYSTVLSGNLWQELKLEPKLPGMDKGGAGAANK